MKSASESNIVYGALTKVIPITGVNIRGTINGTRGEIRNVTLYFNIDRKLIKNLK